MKSEEKALARQLRRQGCTYKEIRAQVPVSQGTLSLWLRDIALTDEQIQALRGRYAAGREKFIRQMRVRRDLRWEEYRREAEREYPALCKDPEFMFGLALYIGEGSKTQQNQLCLTNCDPRVIQRGLEFFVRIGVPWESLRCAIHVHPGLSKESAEVYWHTVTGLPRHQFHTTRNAVSRSSSGRKGHLQPYGTCQIRACSTKLRQKIICWMDLAIKARSFIG